jgi:hypothetical protein
MSGSGYLYGISADSTYGVGDLVWLRGYTRNVFSDSPGDHELIGITEDSEGNEWAIPIYNVFRSPTRIEVLDAYDWTPPNFKFDEYPRDWMIEERKSWDGAKKEGS